MEVEWRVDYTWTVRGTSDTEIEALLGRLTDEIRRNSNDTLVGLYVYGSLVTGDFDKDRSDIDLLAVVDTDVEGETSDGWTGCTHALSKTALRGKIASR
jgi:predicted nucleotidyltransferase